MLKVGGGDGPGAVHPLTKIIPISIKEVSNFTFIEFTPLIVLCLSISKNEFLSKKLALF